MNNICSTKKAVWKPIKEFQEKYSLSKGQAYTLAHTEGFPKIYVGEKTIRVNITEVGAFINKRFN